jgi:heme/copper-type cytochrome/quinol oxidase subunit 4
MFSSNFALVIFWFIVAIIQIILMLKHFIWSKREYSTIKDTFRYGEVNGVRIAGGGNEAIEAINRFIKSLNRDYHQSNIAQFWGYMAGFVASIIGFILSLNMLLES